MISVFTPCCDTRYLDEAFDGLLRQTDPDWEWVILLNGEADYSTNDLRVQIHRDSVPHPTNIGYLKRKACEYCSGDVLLELDSDDILLDTAIEEAAKAFADPSVDFAFSNAINWDFRSHKPLEFPAHYGWQYRDVSFNGLDCREPISPAPVPQNLSRVWFAPDHFRAWRKEFYWRIGGHNPAMRVCDDHELIIRTYLNGKMVHVDKPLYWYRIHGENAWLKYNAEIQQTTLALHDKYIEPMALKWSRDNGLRSIDLCGGIDKADGYESVDLHNADIIFDLNGQWPFEDSSVGVIRAHDAIEHLANPIFVMNEAWRVLAHGGFFLIQVPSSEGAGADSDPTHVSRWNARSFRYYCEAGMRRYIEHAGCHCRFQKLKVETVRMYDDIPCVVAHLIAIKDGPRFHGELLI